MIVLLSLVVIALFVWNLWQSQQIGNLAEAVQVRNDNVDYLLEQIEQINAERFD